MNRLTQTKQSPDFPGQFRPDLIDTGFSPVKIQQRV